MIQHKDVESMIADLNQYAIYADHTGNKALGVAMRRAARMMNDMLREQDAERPAQIIILENIDHG